MYNIIYMTSNLPGSQFSSNGAAICNSSAAAQAVSIGSSFAGSTLSLTSPQVTITAPTSLIITAPTSITNIVSPLAVSYATSPTTPGAGSSFTITASQFLAGLYNVVNANANYTITMDNMANFLSALAGLSPPVIPVTGTVLRCDVAGATTTYTGTLAVPASLAGGTMTLITGGVIAALQNGQIVMRFTAANAATIYLLP